MRQIRGGGHHSITRRGEKILNWTDLFHILSAELYCSQTLPEAKYLFQFVCGDKYVFHVLVSVYKVGLGLELIWRLKCRSKRNFIILKGHVQV